MIFSAFNYKCTNLAVNSEHCHRTALHKYKIISNEQARGNSSKVMIIGKNLERNQTYLCEQF